MWKVALIVFALVWLAGCAGRQSSTDWVPPVAVDGAAPTISWHVRLEGRADTPVVVSGEAVQIRLFTRQDALVTVVAQDPGGVKRLQLEASRRDGGRRSPPEYDADGNEIGSVTSLTPARPDNQPDAQGRVPVEDRLVYDTPLYIPATPATRGRWDRLEMLTATAVDFHGNLAQSTLMVEWIDPLTDPCVAAAADAYSVAMRGARQKRAAASNLAAHVPGVRTGNQPIPPAALTLIRQAEQEEAAARAALERGLRACTLPAGETVEGLLAQIERTR